MHDRVFESRARIHDVLEALGQAKSAVDSVAKREKGRYQCDIALVAALAAIFSAERLCQYHLEQQQEVPWTICAAFYALHRC